MHAGHLREKGLDVGIDREVPRHDERRQDVDAHEGGPAQKCGHLVERHGVAAVHAREKAPEADERNRRNKPDGEEGHAPAQIEAEHASERQARDHGDGRTRDHKAERGGGLVLRRDLDGKRAHDRPEDRMRAGDAEARHKEDPVVRRNGREHVARDEERKHRHHETAALHLRGEQHQRQRHERDDPGVGRHEPAHLGLGAAEVTADVGEKPDRNEFGGVEDEGAERERQYGKPTHEEGLFAGVGHDDVRFDFVRDCRFHPQAGPAFFLADENLSAAVRRRQRPEAASMTHVKPLRETCSV